MASTLPPGAHGACAGVLLYSLVCFFSSSFVLWLVWVHNERMSCGCSENPSLCVLPRALLIICLDVALLAFFTSLSTLASIIQQIHTIINWEGLKTAQYLYVQDTVGNPEIVIAGASYGLDLVLFYIRMDSSRVDQCRYLL